MNLRKQYKYFLFAFFGISIFLLIGIQSACAQDEPCDPAEVTVIARNADGEFIPDISFSIYKQVVDVYGLPKPGQQVSSGRIDPLLGRAVVKFGIDPDYSGAYAVKMWHKNPDVGAFWFYNELFLGCGTSATFTQNLSGLKFVLRDPEGSLKKNQDFTVYTQRRDVDGNPIKEREDFVTTLNTSEEGEVDLYIADKTRSIDGKGNEYFIFESQLAGGTFIKWGIKVNFKQTTLVNYIFSDMILEIKDASQQRFIEKNVDIFEQSVNLKGEYILGRRLISARTDLNGLVKFEYPAGKFAVVVKDKANQDIAFWDIEIVDQKRQEYTLTTNFTKINVQNLNLPNIQVVAYNLLEDAQGLYYRSNQVWSGPLDTAYSVSTILAPKPYLFVVKIETNEYGKTLWLENNKFQELNIDIKEVNLVEPQQRFEIKKGAVVTPAPTTSQSITDRLRGYILLQVEDNGEAWYVDYESKKRYYMKDGEVAYNMLREFGLGISNADIAKIPVGIDQRFNEADVDGDWLPDKMEDGLGTNRNLKDTDGDGFDDGTELFNGYSPTEGGGKKLPLDSNFANKLKGKILLQIQSHGEAWYVNPKDGKRYYMKDGASAYEIMRFLSLGITNADLAKIPTGILSGY